MRSRAKKRIVKLEWRSQNHSVPKEGAAHHYCRHDRGERAVKMVDLNPTTSITTLSGNGANTN